MYHIITLSYCVILMYYDMLYYYAIILYIIIYYYIILLYFIISVRPFFARSSQLRGDMMRKNDTEIPPKRAFF
jgi:hypothetical protein